MADITVRGAGIFGLTIAWCCVQRGARVQVIDPHGAASGSSGGIVGALAPHVPENWNAKKAFQFDSLIEACTFWTAVQEAGGGDPGYARPGRLQPIADDAALQRATERGVGAQTLWQGRATWEVVPSPADGWAPVSPTGKLVFDTLSAHVHPRQACKALVRALAARGVEIRSDGPDSGAVVWATGVAGLDALGAGRTRAVGAGVKGQAALLQHDARGRPQLFADALHIIPHTDGTVAVGSTTERDFETPSSTDAQLDAVVARARAAVPALQDARVIGRWAGVRPRARSRAPILGPWPDRPGHFIANGGFKIGFGMAPKLGDVMADLIVEGRDTVPPDFRVAASL